MRESILQLPEDAWRPALRQDGTQRDGAQIAEITHVERLDLTPWPEGSRVIIRRERPHPGAQLKFTDHEGHRFQATLTDLTGDMVEIERLHRGRGDAENLIRGAKQTGLENLPFREFNLNAVWLELSLIAQDLIAWTQRLCLDRRARDLRTQSAALPAAAHRRTALPSTPAARSCASQRTGHGPASSPPRSPGYASCQHPPADQPRPGEQTQTMCTSPAFNADGPLSRKHGAPRRSRRRRDLTGSARRQQPPGRPHQPTERWLRGHQPRLLHDPGLNPPDVTPLPDTHGDKQGSVRQSF